MSLTQLKFKVDTKFLQNIIVGHEAYKSSVSDHFHHFLLI